MKEKMNNYMLFITCSHDVFDDFWLVLVFSPDRQCFVDIFVLYIILSFTWHAHNNFRIIYWYMSTNSWKIVRVDLFFPKSSKIIYELNSSYSNLTTQMSYWHANWSRFGSSFASATTYGKEGFSLIITSFSIINYWIVISLYSR